MKNVKKVYSTESASKTLILFFVILFSSTTAASSGEAASLTTMHAFIPNSDNNTISVIDIEAENAITPQDGARGRSLFSGFLIACGQLATESMLNSDAPRRY